MITNDLAKRRYSLLPERQAQNEEDAAAADAQATEQQAPLPKNRKQRLAAMLTDALSSQNRVR